MVKLTEERVLAEIVERIVHPAHVPFEVEAQAAFGDGLRHAREGRGFLGDHRDTGLVEVHQRVHLLEEFNRLDVLAAAVAIRDPFAGLTGVVEVEHRSHRIDAQAVDVETLEPRKRGADQEAAHLVSAVIKDQRTPVLVLAETRIGMLVKMRSVEAGQRKEVARKVGRDPIDDHADVRAMEGVDHRHEVERRAEAMRRRVEASDLIAPRTIERVLGRWHQFDVREAHLHAVGGELLAELAVTEYTASLFRDAAPGGQVHLVNRHRARAQVAAATGFHPGCVVPDELREITDDRGVIRRRLEMQAVGIRLQERRRVVRPHDLVLVAGAGVDSGDEEFPDTGSPQITHRMGAAVPEVMVADDRDASGRGSPDRERDAQHAIEGADMGAELIVGAVIVTLA